MIMVHRGWQNPPTRNQEATSHKTRSTSTLTSNSNPQKRSATLLPPKQEFQFINAGTEKDGEQDLEARRLVRRHVASRRREQRQDNSLPSSSPSCALTSSLSSPDTSILARRNPGPTFIAPSLDPHPQLTPMIYYVQAIGDAMFPLSSSIKFNPISPANWFDWALSDDALFQALMYTMSSYEGMIRGAPGGETKEAIGYGGECLRLLNARLREKRIERDEVAESTIGTVSCLAMVEVSVFIFCEFQKRRS